MHCVCQGSNLYEHGKTIEYAASAWTHTRLAFATYGSCSVEQTLTDMLIVHQDGYLDATNPSLGLTTT